MNNTVLKWFKIRVFSIIIFCSVCAISDNNPEERITDIVEKTIEKISKMPPDKQESEFTRLSGELALCLGTSIGSRIPENTNINNRNDDVLVEPIYTIFGGDMLFWEKVILSNNNNNNAKDVIARRINSQVILYPISTPVTLSEKVLMTIALIRPYILIQKNTIELCRKKIANATNLEDFLPFLVVLYINGDKDILKKYESDKNTELLLQVFNGYAQTITEQIKKANPELYKKLLEKGDIVVWGKAESSSVPRRRSVRK